MNITVFGATGGTGRHVVTQALAQGHRICAVVRDPARLPLPESGRLTVVRADVMRPEEIKPALAEADAVISALGSGDLKPTTVISESARSVTTAMDAAGVRRLVLVSNSGMHTDGDTWPTRALVKPVLRRVLRHPWADAARAEQVVSASDLDWTLVRPPRLTNKAYTGVYRTCRDRNVRGGFSLSRADLAHFLLSVVDDPATHRAAVSLAY